jgi:toxin-antitoxin system PIN domain toxin
MTLSVFPDLNLWLALTNKGHCHFQSSDAWYDSLDESTVLYFCRHTQMGFFRLLTNTSVMSSDTRTQSECWQIYEDWLEKGRARMMAEPVGLERYFKARTKNDQSSTKEWADAYLAAFAEAARLQLVTFDKALAGKSKGAILLG